MKQEFITENFLLETETAIRLFHDHAKELPVIDYHCHLPVEEIASNKKFENITKVWLNGDHYKWRAMRTNGVDEKYCTGGASDWEKFLAWAETVPHTVRNPLFHWTHMELKNPFNITGKLLNKNSAKEIWEECNALLQKDEFSTQGLIKHFKVEVVCTTDDPTDNLEYHQIIKRDFKDITVLPAFRPDKGMIPENPAVFYPWFEKLKSVTNSDINSFGAYIEAIRGRHDYFHENGCRLSDHGINTAYAEDYSETETENIFQKILSKTSLSNSEILKFKSAMMYEYGLMNNEKGWVQQLHLGALRNANSRMYRELGPDTGFDSIGDFETALPLAKYLNRLDDRNKLAKTILYNLNPADNDMMATMGGNFQGGGIPGKMQYGSAWWFLDQKDGIEKQINSLSNMGLLSKFVGMLTDSRSFLSYPRHEYFRRILCNIIGNDVRLGLLPDSDELLVPLVENVSYYNAKNYFNFIQSK